MAAVNRASVHTPPLFLQIAGVILALAFLVWPAIFNGQPFYFPDTTAYVRGAATGFEKLTHSPSAWTQAEGDAESALARTNPASPPSVSSMKDKTVLAGRSIYYGTWLYLGDQGRSFWLVAIVQAAAVLLATALALRALALPTWPHLLVVAGVIGLFSTASFYSTILMPDVFAAITILGAALLIAERVPWPRRQLTGWGILLAAAVVFHSSHVLIVAAMLAMAVAWNVAQRSWANWRGLALLAACLAWATLAELMFGLGVRHFVGAPPLRPPFLTAHLIEDGPGYRYLKASCPGSGFEVCKYLDRLPQAADDFLWSFDARGVFATASSDSRRRLSDEQARFAKAVTLNDPGAVAMAAARDFGRQLEYFGLREFNWVDSSPEDFARKLPLEYRSAFRASDAARNQMPTGPFSTLDLWVVIGSLAIILAACAAKPWRSRLGPMTLRVAGFLIAGVIANAAICGILSGPHNRYQARVIWLVPFLALVLVMRLLGARAAGTARPTRSAAS